jgi:hypothetical protein
MGCNERLSDEVLGQIVGAMQAAQSKHHCRFDEVEAKRIHAFSEILDHDGMANFREVIQFGANLKTARQAGLIALAGAVAVGIAGLIWNAVSHRG